MWSPKEDFTVMKSPLEIRYIKILKLGLNIIAAWDVRHIEGVLCRFIMPKKIFLIIQEYMCLVGGILYLKNNSGVLPFIQLGHTNITVFINIIACTRLSMIFIQSYHSLIVMFINKMHLFNYKDVSAYGMKIHLTVHKLSHYFTLYIAVLTCSGIMLFHGIPIYTNITSGAFSNPLPENVTYMHSVYYELPFDYKTNFWGFLTVFLANIYISVVAMLCFMAFDLLISLIIFHIWGHLKILIKYLEEFPLPESLGSGTCKMYSQEELIFVHNRLRQSIVHHKLILDSISATSDVFGVHLLFYYGFFQVCGCFLLLQCSQMTAQALTRYGLLTVGLHQQLIQISAVFELLGSVYEKLSFAIYNMPWEFMDAKNRKLVLIFIRQAQKPVNLKAGSMVSVGVQTMLSILKTSISYFIMLKTVAVNE